MTIFAGGHGGGGRGGRGRLRLGGTGLFGPWAYGSCDVPGECTFDPRDLNFAAEIAHAHASAPGTSPVASELTMNAWRAKFRSLPAAAPARSTIGSGRGPQSVFGGWSEPPVLGPRYMWQVGADPVSLSAIQAALNTMGANPPLVADNKWGPKTQAAVKAFQANGPHGQGPSATPFQDGLLDGPTLSALGFDPDAPITSAGVTVPRRGGPAGTSAAQPKTLNVPAATSAAKAPSTALATASSSSSITAKVIPVVGVGLLVGAAVAFGVKALHKPHASK